MDTKSATTSSMRAVSRILCTVSWGIMPLIHVVLVIRLVRLVYLFKFDLAGITDSG